MGCEMCGREDNLVEIVVEGVFLNVCNRCKSYGRIVEVRKEETRPVFKKREEIIEKVVDNYSELIKLERINSGLELKDFAKKLNEKEGVVSRLESGCLKPSLELARKLSKILGVKLITKEGVDVKVEKSKEGTYTIGDMLGDKIN